MQAPPRQALRLVEPSRALLPSFLAMLAELEMSGDLGRLDRLALNHPDEYFRAVREMTDGPTGRLPGLYWLTDGDEVVGQVCLRPEPEGPRPEDEGHIGYVVRPSRRRRGYASAALRLAIRKAADLGIAPVFITCDSDNLASIAVIEHTNGKLADSAESPLTGKLVYKFSIRTGDARCP